MEKDILLIQPAFDSILTDLIIELDYLRKKSLEGSTHGLVFFQLKNIFHTLESIGSARIEGNNTTIAEYIETKIEEPDNISNNIREIRNLENAMQFIEDNVKDYPINRLFISEIHKKIVENLPAPPDGEGDNTPGIYRKHNVRIHKSSHIPPDFLLIDALMDELVGFVNNEDSPKYDLLKSAIAHHRFVWIHPFSNGNGRTVRMLTYAMLVKLGFNVNIGRILNPTAIFCSNRNDYYDHLSKADLGNNDGIESWCIYVLKGLKDEIQKIDKLCDYDYLKDTILIPAIKFSLEREVITDLEAKILIRVVEKQVIQANHLKDIFKGKFSSEISRQIKRLIEKKMLLPEADGARKYVLRFDNNYLLRGIIKMLGQNGFLPTNEKFDS
ncbi:Fic family protein [Emticicia oligotrophica]|uniref:Fic family protein n=1 Tax=Emticicia oligotrophica TaxID=312279 RepID=UPI00273BF7B2|nr:Fic family protein [Emticicia oligotrophica]